MPFIQKSMSNSKGLKGPKGTLGTLKKNGMCNGLAWPSGKALAGKQKDPGSALLFKNCDL